MNKPRIYTSLPLREGQSIVLDSKASNHLSQVLRLPPGQELKVFNGQGGEFDARISAIVKHQVEVEVLKFYDTKTHSSLSIELGIALSKGDRMDWIIQKATELGVNSITPIFSDRTQVKLKEQRLTKRMTHWHQVIISACEQCGQNLPPQLNDAQKLLPWCRDSSSEYKFVLHHRNEQKLQHQSKPKSISLLIGPEGGLSQQEIDTAQRHEFQGLSLGPRVLRTETAPLAAIAILQFIWGDMS